MPSGSTTLHNGQLESVLVDFSENVFIVVKTVAIARWLHFMRDKMVETDNDVHSKLVRNANEAPNANCSQKNRFDVTACVRATRRVSVVLAGRAIHVSAVEVFSDFSSRKPVHTAGLP